MDENQSVGGGLHIPKDMGVAESASEESRQFWNTIDSVNEQLRGWGLPDNEAPHLECPAVTAELLTTTDINAYTVLYVSQLRWYNYTTQLLASIRSAKVQIENELEDIKVKTRIKYRKQNHGLARNEKTSKEDIDDIAESDPYYRDLKKNWQITEQYRLQTEAWSEGLDRNLRTISRQIENRKVEGDSGRREANLPADASGKWQNRRSPTFG